MKCTDIGGSVSEEAEAYVLGACISSGEAEPDRDRQMRADGRDRSIGATADVGDVHRAAFAAAQSLCFAEDLGERPIDRRTFGEHRTVAAIGAEHRVAVAQHSTGADGDRFLTRAQVRRSAHEVGHEQTLRLLLEQADLDHPSEKAEELIGWNGCLLDSPVIVGVRHALVLREGA